MAVSTNAIHVDGACTHLKQNKQILRTTIPLEKTIIRNTSNFINDIKIKKYQHREGDEI